MIVNIIDDFNGTNRLLLYFHTDAIQKMPTKKKCLKKITRRILPK